MIKKSLFAASLALLAVGAGRSASAGPVFLEPYGEIFGARTFISSPADSRPKDALQTQDTRKEEPTQRFLVSPFVRDDDNVFLIGGGLAYANAANPRHPWSLNFNYANVDIDGTNFDFNVFDINGKIVAWQPDDPKLPVVSLVGRYQDFEDIGNRWDILVAADQGLGKDLYFTANLGWANADPDFASDDESDFVAGVGLTWKAMKKLSVSANYVIDNDVDGEDFWSISAFWTFDEMSAVRVGAGKHGTVFANYIAKFDW